MCSKRYYLRSRYYDPSTGRFTQRDAFLGFYTDPLSLNRYTYAHNNPIKYIDPSGYAAVQVTMPNGQKVTAELKNGVTTMPDGSRPPVGAIVHSTNGKDYQMQASGSGVEVPKGSTPVAVSTPTGTQAGTVKSGVTTMTSTGSRPEDGWIVHAPNGVDYQMNTALGYGTPTTVVPVLTPNVGITMGGLANGVTTMLDGSRPQDGAIVIAPNGVAYQMDDALGRGVQVGPAKSTSDISNASSMVTPPMFMPQSHSATAPSGIGVDWRMIGEFASYFGWISNIGAALAAAPTWLIASIGAVGVLGNVANQVSILDTAASDVRAWVDAQANIRHQINNNTVYVIRDIQYGINYNKVVYVGRTSDYSTRQNHHQTRTDALYPTESFAMQVVATGLTNNESRVLEQALIGVYTLSALNNAINSIAPRKWDNFSYEIGRIESLLGGLK